MTVPEISEGAFARWQSGQRCKNLLQDQLPMLLITREHLKRERENKSASLSLWLCRIVNSNASETHKNLQL